MYLLVLLLLVVVAFVVEQPGVLPYYTPALFFLMCIWSALNSSICHPYHLFHFLQARLKRFYDKQYTYMYITMITIQLYYLNVMTIVILNITTTTTTTWWIITGILRMFKLLIVINYYIIMFDKKFYLNIITYRWFGQLSLSSYFVCWLL